MAKRNFNSKRKYRSKGGFSRLERIAYTQGVLERGKKNPNSRIYDSFQKGLNGLPTKKSKPIA